MLPVGFAGMSTILSRLSAVNRKTGWRARVALPNTVILMLGFPIASITQSAALIPNDPVQLITYEWLVSIWGETLTAMFYAPVRIYRK